MSKNKILLSIILSFAMLLAPMTQETNALSGNQFKPGRIMDDAIFFSPAGMSSAQIQHFLNSKVPACDTNGDKPYAGTTRRAYAASKGVSTPFICLKSYTQNTPERPAESGLCNYMSPKSNQTAAQIIYDVANSCNVNPKVLLVLLQKEQSLVTDDWPWPVQYEKATGFACPDTAPCDPSYAGFFYQVHSAARQFKRYSVDSHLFNYRAKRNNNILWHPNAACGSSTVYIENQATAGLYNYTPYRPNQAALNNLYGTGDGCSSYGNRNFWRMYNDWFGSTHASYIINVTGTKTLYLLSGDTVYGFPNQDVLKAYGFDNIPVTGVSSSYLNSLNNGGILSTTFNFEGSNTVRLADHGKHYGISSSTVCDNWGLPCFDTQYQKQLASYFSALIPGGGLVKEVMWTPQDGYSRMVAGKRQPIYGSMGTLGYSATSATPISTPINSRQPYGSPLVANNTLIKFGSSPSILYHNAGLYYSFPSFSVYKDWMENNKKPSYHDTRSTSAASPPSVSRTLGTLVHNGTAKYIVSKGRKHDITSQASNWPATSDHAFAAGFLSGLPTSTVSSSSLFRDSSTGVIYQAKDQKRNYFTSLRDFYASGGNNKPLHHVSSSAGTSLGPGYIMLGEGGLFKPSNGSSIFVVAPGNSTSYVLTEMGQISRLGLADVKVIYSDSPTTAAYPSATTFKDFIKVGSDHYALSRDYKRIFFSSTNMARWGANTAQSSSFTSQISNGIYKSVVDPRFAVAPDGTIYYGQGGTKRPITSFERYKSLGGNKYNTFDTSDSFLSTLPTGTPIH